MKDKPNLKQTMTEALQYMGPGLISALGTKDPKEISNAYSQAMKQMEDDKTAELNRQVSIERNRPNFDFGFVDKQTGRTLKIDKNTGNAFTMGDESFARPQDIVEGETFRQSKTLPFRDASVAQGQERIDLSRQKAGQLSNKQIESLAAYKSILVDIDNIKMLKPGVNTGPFITRYGRFAQIMGISDVSDDFVRLRTSTNSLLANYLKSISGAQVSAEEARRLYAVIPRIEDDDNVFEAKLKQFEKMANIGGQSLLQAIASGQPLRREQVDMILQTVDKKVAIGQIQKDENAFLERLDKALSLKK